MWEPLWPCDKEFPYGLAPSRRESCDFFMVMLKENLMSFIVKAMIY